MGVGLCLATEDPRSGDAAALLAELTAYLEPLYPEDGDEPAAPWTLDDVACAFVVARVGGLAAGCGGLATCAEPGALEIVRMYVRSGFRGRGIADRVLIELEGLARDEGAKQLMLRCGPRQPGALRVYERNGYVRRAAFAHHREHATNIFYAKAL